MFDIRNLPSGAGSIGSFRINEKVPNVIEGADVYDVLCPVSKLTGFRENPLSLLSKVLDPAKARLVDSVLQEIPSLYGEDKRISDNDALDMIMDRLSTGTPSEDALIRNKLSDMLDVLLPQDVRQTVEQKIEFTEPDVESSAVEVNA